MISSYLLLTVGIQKVCVKVYLYTMTPMNFCLTEQSRKTLRKSIFLRVHSISPP